MYRKPSADAPLLCCLFGIMKNWSDEEEGHMYERLKIFFTNETVKRGRKQEKKSFQVKFVRAKSCTQSFNGSRKRKEEIIPHILPSKQATSRNDVITIHTHTKKSVVKPHK